VAEQRGSKSRIIYDTETVYKTTPSPADAWILPFASETLKLNRNLVESKVIRNTRNPSKPSRGNREVAGDITTELNPMMGRLFWNVLGTVSVTGVSSPYTHTFKISDLPAGMIFEKQFTDLDTPKYFQYKGCKLNTLKVTVKPEGMVDVVFGVMGAVETITATSFDGSATDQGHNPFDGYEATITKDSSPLATVTELDFEINNNLDGSMYVLDGTGERRSLPDGLVKVSGNLKALFENDVLYAVALNHTECKLIVTFTKGSGVGTAGNEKLIVTIPELIFQPSAPTISGPTGLLVELPFVGYYNDSTEATALMFELKSATANFAI